MDVETRFLDGNIKGNVVNGTTEKFIDPTDAGKICKLLRSMHGPEQASRSRNLHLDGVIKGFWKLFKIS
jgi:hypothetical protein